MLFSLPVSGTAQSIVLDLDAQPLSFLNSNRTVITNTGNNGRNAGSVHEYLNVITTGGANPMVVKAQLTIVQRSGISIGSGDNEFDDDSGSPSSGIPGRFQPRLSNPGSGGEGIIEYELRFFNQATGQEIHAKNFYFTAADIDGGVSGNPNSGPREFVEIGGYTSYTVANNSQLTITHNFSTGRTRFRSIPGERDGINFDNTASVIVYIQQPINRLNFALGLMGNTSTARQFSINIGAQSDSFTGPTTEVEAPFPIAVDDIGFTVSSVTGGVAVIDVVANDFYDGDLLTISDVTLSRVSSSVGSPLTLNTATGEVSVAPGTPAGTYELTYRICLAPGTLPNPLPPGTTASDFCDTAIARAFVVEPNLEVKKTAVASVYPGQVIPYVITVHNAGDVTTPGTMFSDPLPAGVQYVANSATIHYGTGGDVPIVVGSDGTVYPFASNFNLGDIASNRTVTIKFSVLVPLDYPDETVSNQGTVGYDGGNGIIITTLSDDPTVAGPANPTVTDVLDLPTGFGTCPVAGLFQLAGQGASQQLYRFDAATGVHTAFLNPNKQYQALAFNSQDGFLYGIHQDGPDRILDRIGANGVVYEVGELDLAQNVDGAEFDGDGYLYTVRQSEGGAMSRFDVTGVNGDLSKTVINLSSNAKLYDLAYSATDNVFYGVNENDNNTVVRIALSGTVTSVAPLGKTGNFTSVNYDTNGNLLVYEMTGTLYVVPSVYDGFNAAQVVTAHTGLPHSGNNGDFAGCGTYNVLLPNIVATKTAIDEVVPGGNITYTIEITNNGDAAALGVTFQDALPSGTTYVPNTAVVDGSPVVLGGNPNTYPFASAYAIGDLGIDESVVITFSVQVGAVPAGTLISNQGTVDFPAADDPVLTDDPDEPGDEDPTVTVVVPEMNPFGACDLYLLGGVPGANPPQSIYRYDLNAGTGTAFPLTPSISAEFQALAYNSSNNFLYGIVGSSNHLYQIDADGEYRDLGSLGVGGGISSAEFDASGNLFITTEGDLFGIYKVEVSAGNPALSATYLPFDIPGDYGNTNIRFYDLAFSPANGSFYGVSMVNYKVLRVDVSSGTEAEVTVLGEVANGEYNAVHYENGTFYYHARHNNVYMVAGVDDGFVGSDIVQIYSNSMQGILQGGDIGQKGDWTGCGSYVNFEPLWTLTKVAAQTSYDAVGDVLTYTLTLENTGNTPITSVTVSDPTADEAPVRGADQTGNGDDVLEPGEIWTFTAKRTVTLADLNAGSYTNAATATGTPTGGDLEPAEAEETVDAVQNPTLSLAKEVTGRSTDPVALGTVLTYAVTATNTGNVTLANVVVSDPKLSQTSQTCATLLPGADCVLTGTYTVQQADVDTGKVLNEATVGTDTPDTDLPDPATHEEPVPQNSGLQVTKTADPANPEAALGAVLSYTVTVTNTGNVTLTNVQVTDPLTGLSETVATLAPGAANAASYTTSLTVTQPMVDAGLVSNTAAATADDPLDPSGEDLEDDDTVETPISQNPVLAVTKTQTNAGQIPSASAVGQVLEYQIVLENTGNVTLTGVQVSDTLPDGADGTAGLGGPAESMAADGRLEVGETWTYTASYTVTQADLDAGQALVNAASATADQLDEPVGDAAETPVSGNPSIGILKKGALDGGTITYTYTVVNTGNVTLYDIDVAETGFEGAGTAPTSAYASGGSDLGGDPSLKDLAPGEALVFTGAYALVQGDYDAGVVRNQATATGGDPQGGTVTDLSDDDSDVGNPGSTDPEDPDSDDPTDTDVPQNPELTVEKTALTTSYSKIGDILEFQIVVKNSGNVTLSAIEVSDPTATITAGNPISTLAPGAVDTVFAQYTVTGDDLVTGAVINVAKATGMDPNQEEVSDEDDAQVQAVFGEIVANDDDYTGTVANSVTGTDLGNVLGNDLLDGHTATIGTVEITIVTPATNHGVQLDRFTGQVSVEPGTPEGDYTIVYQICEILNPTNCDTATVSVKVECDGDTQISGRVLRDDPAQTPLANVPVTLIPQSGTPGQILMQVTDAEGRYSFGNLVPGDYLVQVQDANLNSARDLYPVESSLFFTTLTACHPQFHNFVYSTSELLVLGDLVWLDVNGNGEQDEWYDANNDGVINQNIPDAQGYVDYSTWEWIDLNGDGRWDGPENEGELNRAGIGNDQSSNVYVTGPNGFEKWVTIGLLGYWRERPGDPYAFGEYRVELNMDEYLQNAAKALALTGLVKPIPQAAAHKNAETLATVASALNVDALTCEITTGNVKTGWVTDLEPRNLGLDFGIACYVKKPIIANDDFVGPISAEHGAPNAMNALYNDTYDGEPVVRNDITVKVLVPASHPSVTLDTDTGVVSVAPGTPPGIYTIEYEICEVANPTNCDDAVITVVVSEGEASLAGVKFHDKNADGVRDADEPGLAGWTIYADLNGNGKLDEGEPYAVSDESGAWTIAGLPYGEISIREVLPEGAEWLQSLPGPGAAYRYLVTVSDNMSDDGLLFGNYRPDDVGLTAGIAGVKWHDVDGDGVRNNDEPLLSGWTIYLDLNGNGEWDENEPSQVTGQDGAFAFTGLAAGTYTVREAMQDGWLQSYPGKAKSFAHTVEVTDGFLTAAKFDFGNSQSASLAGVKWHDADVNGKRADTEALLAGWSIYLDLNGNGRHDQDEPLSVTDAQGAFSFEGLLPGAYTIGEVDQNGWKQAYPGGDGMHRVQLASGQTQTAEFGNARDEEFIVQPGYTTIEGNVWYDYAEDSAWDHKLGLDVPAEQRREIPVEGWLITLRGQAYDGKTVEMTTNTEPDGSYSFRDVPRGEYRVSREYRDTWVPAFPLVVMEDPAGQDHVIRVDNGYGGLASKNRVVYAGNTRGWLGQLEAGSHGLYAGAYLYLDTNADGAADVKFFVSGPMNWDWTSAKATLRSEFEITDISLVGYSEQLGRIELRPHPQRRILGELTSGRTDSLAHSDFTMPFDLFVGGERWIMPTMEAPQLQGGVSQMLPYNQKHTAYGSPVALMDLAGREKARLLGLEFIPLYGADFATNQSVFGTAPATQYSVLMENNGARHVMHPILEEHELTLGTGIESTQIFVRNRLRGGSSSVKAGATESDGVVFLTPVESASSASIAVTASGQGYLHAWIDYNRDGVWTDEERIVSGLKVSAGENVVDFTVPVGISTGESYARFRLCECPEMEASTGVTSGGEVEDYLVFIRATGGTVTGRVWLDADRNAELGAGETLLAGIRVFADINGNGRLDEGEPVVTTNAQGVYSLAGIPQGDVRIQPDYGNRWSATNLPGTVHAMVSLKDGDLVEGLNFGLVDLMSTDLEESATVPLEFALDQNYPNPFNPTTAIRYRLAEPVHVRLSVYDVSGRLVTELVDKQQTAGEYVVSFDASGLSSGVYVYRLVAGTYVFTQKLTLVK